MNLPACAGTNHMLSFSIVYSMYHKLQKELWYIYLSVCLSIDLYIYLSIYQYKWLIYLINLSIYLQIYQSMYLPIDLSIYQIYLSVYLPIYLSNEWYIYPCADLSIYISIYLFIYPSIHPSQTYISNVGCSLQHGIEMLYLRPALIQLWFQLFPLQSLVFQLRLQLLDQSVEKRVITD